MVSLFQLAQFVEAKRLITQIGTVLLVGLRVLPVLDRIVEQKTLRRICVLFGLTEL